MPASSPISSSPGDVVRIGFIGAGGICRTRHLPGLKAIPGVEVRVVCNRTPESSQRVAADFGIAHTVDDWREVLDRPDIDAVFIGTWPYRHCEMAIAALEAGKHVFCQARMAMNVDEARRMAAAAAAHPRLVARLCPPPHRIPFEPYIRQVLATGVLGPITLVEVISHAAGNLNPDAVHWRERAEFSGEQVLTMGIVAETLNAWVGPYEHLCAETATPLNVKRDQGQAIPIAIPQVVAITGRLTSGATIVEQYTGLAADTTTPGETITIFGLRGTLRYRFGSEVIEQAAFGGALEPVAVPANLRRPWMVESDFIALVRAVMKGQPAPCTGDINPDFDEGLQYMRKVAAVHRSVREGSRVRLADI